MVLVNACVAFIKASIFFFLLTSKFFGIYLLVRSVETITHARFSLYWMFCNSGNEKRLDCERSSQSIPILPIDYSVITLPGTTRQQLSECLPRSARRTKKKRETARSLY